MILPQYHEEVFGCKGASGVAMPLPHWHSNVIEALGLLHLHSTVVMAAAMVTSVPCESHPLPGRQKGLQGRRRPPLLPSEAASPPVTRRSSSERQ